MRFLVDVKILDIEVILTNGGTGIALRDVTIETVKSLFHKEIDRIW